MFIYFINLKLKTAAITELHPPKTKELGQTIIDKPVVCFL